MTDSQRPVALPPIVKIVSVKAPPERAFARFTKEIATWWPLRSHSVGEADAQTVAMEGRVGGRIVERTRSGAVFVWGTIDVWEPPHRVAFSWHPGDEPERATHVELLFTASGTGTRVELRHRGFEHLGAKGSRIRRVYPIGWAYVLGLYAERRGPFIVGIKALTSALMTLRSWRERRAGKASHSPA
jgi:uncharacterized protein YndB with AHSA1/START domain